jgi:tetratricopeptide (TPR) repeat protein
MRNRVIIILVLFSAATFTGCQSQAHGKVNVVKQRHNANSADAHLALATDQYKRGNYEAAISSAKTAVEAAPTSPSAYIIYGKSLLALGRYDEADACFSRAVELAPSLDEGWYGKGLVAEETGNRPAALVHFEKAMELNPSNASAIIRLADIYNSSGQEEKALALIEDKCKTIPDAPELKRTAAAMYIRLGRTDEAVRMYEGLCQSEPDNLKCMDTLGHAYNEAGRQRDAAEVFETLCEKAPADETKNYALLAAGCYMRAGVYDACVRVCNKYASLCKEDVSFWIIMGQAALGIHDIDRGLYAAKRATTIEPTNSEARVLMGCAQYAAGRYAEAVETFERVTDGEGSFVWVMKGRSYAKLGDKVKAAKAFDRATTIDPANETAKRLAAELAMGATSQK